MRPMSSVQKIENNSEIYKFTSVTKVQQESLKNMALTEQRSHSRPMMFGLQRHSPDTLSQLSVPCLLHVQAEDKRSNIYFQKAAKSLVR